MVLALVYIVTIFLIAIITPWEGKWEDSDLGDF